LTSVLVGDGVGCALTRLLRPEEDPVLGVLDSWPLTVPDVLGESGPARVGRPPAGDGLATALERLLRPDRELVLQAIRSLEVTTDDGSPDPDRPVPPHVV